MTALQSILKEAKALRKSFPTRYKKWTDYVKQASAIYASKHKGKSPVGKKHAVKKKTAKKKAVGKVKTTKHKYIFNIHKRNEFGDTTSTFKKVTITSSNQYTAKDNIYKKYPNSKYFVELSNSISGIKKKVAKKAVNKKTVVKKKVAKKVAHKRKPSEKAVLKSIKHAEKVQIRHMSGIGALSSHIINDVKNAHTKLVQWQKTLITLQNTRKSLPASMKKFNSMDIKRVKDHIKEIKTHISQLKKQIK